MQRFIHRYFWISRVHHQPDPDMLHDHIKIIKWSLTAMSYLHCFPIKWDKSAKRVTHVKSRRKLIIIKTVNILLLSHFGLVAFVLRDQYRTGCVYTLLPNIFMWLVNVIHFLSGMGVNLANKAGELFNTMIGFEEWLQDTFDEMNILPEKNSGESITNR